MPGRFITVEGPDGSGKTTLIQGLLARLEAHLLPDLLATREPGGEPLAEKIRDLILDPAHTDLDARAEALLYAASRRQHLVHKIQPALAAGKWVVCDRFVDSSIAYQAWGREIGVAGIQAINDFATEGQAPDLTLYLDLSAEEGIRRIQTQRSDEYNRLDQESIAFHKRVVAGYQELLAKDQGQRIKAIDASQAPEACLDQAWKILQAAYPEDFRQD
ncbi:dTMP kinase [Aerococcus sp. UMB7834]|uniref:dTMP kinase n=1 Tax=Aerococcus sp. UMB7834 TaxID=3046342 RepID=UPI00254AC23A|nr:dTMP kinase [Aerococcus sp. UMB7834]MDK6804770.1 dTMP kinase [Aerococcus sp. UMB7834]